jgi:AcrR family transcriptional regulator
MSTTARHTAAERREAVLAAATREFGAKGLHGTSTDDIARSAGISQPYLFRLFGSKKELYLATCQRSIDDLYELFSEAAKGTTGVAALQAMGEAYGRVTENRERLMLMLKSWSTDDPDIKRVCRSSWRNLVDLAEQASGAPPEVVTRFFAHGILTTVLISLGFLEDPEPWANRLFDASQDAMRE